MNVMVYSNVAGPTLSVLQFFFLKYSSMYYGLNNAPALITN